MTRELEFSQAIKAAQKAYEFCVQLDSNIDKPFVVLAARRLIDQLRFYQEQEAKRQAAR